MSDVTSGNTSYVDDYTGSAQFVVTSLQDKGELKIISEYTDLPAPVNGEIELDKDNYSLWQFAALIHLPIGVTIFRKGVTILGLNPSAGLIADAENKALFRDFDGLPEVIRGMSLQNTAVNGSIFNSKQSTIVLNHKFIMENCDILSSAKVGNVSGFGEARIKDVDINDCPDGGFVFGEPSIVPSLSFQPPYYITLDNLKFINNPIPDGDCITVDATKVEFGDFSVNTMNIHQCELESTTVHKTIKIIQPGNINSLRIGGTAFLGNGQKLDGINRNSPGVFIQDDCYPIIPSTKFYWAIYNDTNTETFPIACPHDTWTKITNNKATTQSDLPSQITSLWDSIANKIDLREVDLDTMVNVTALVRVTSDKITTLIESRLFGLDTANTIIQGANKNLQFQNQEYTIELNFNMPAITQDMIDNGFEIQMNPADPNNSTLITKVNSITVKRA